MTSASTILVATDLSARSDRPLERALLLRRQLAASLIVLHVIDTEQRLSLAQEQKLVALLRDEFDLEPDDANVCFEYGSVPTVVARAAKDHDCSLIVTGVARFNSPQDFVLGSAVDYLVRQSSVPVLVVKRRARRPYGRLVVATDFSPASVRALHAAANLFPDARVRLVHAYQAAFEAFLDRDTTAPFIRDEARMKMKRVVEALPEALRSRVETVVEEGHAATVLTQSVSELGDDLLVLGTWHRRGHAHFMGSDDVWTLPAKGPCDLLLVGKGIQGGRLLGQGTRSSRTASHKQ